MTRKSYVTTKVDDKQRGLATDLGRSQEYLGGIVQRDYNEHGLAAGGPSILKADMVFSMVSNIGGALQIKG